MLHLDMSPKHRHMVKAHQTADRPPYIKNTDDGEGKEEEEGQKERKEEEAKSMGYRLGVTRQKQWKSFCVSLLAFQQTFLPKQSSVFLSAHVRLQHTPPLPSQALRAWQQCTDIPVSFSPSPPSSSRVAGRWPWWPSGPAGRSSPPPEFGT